MPKKKKAGGGGKSEEEKRRDAEMLAKAQAIADQNDAKAKADAETKAAAEAAVLAVMSPSAVQQRSKPAPVRFSNARNQFLTKFIRNTYVCAKIDKNTCGTCSGP